MSTIEKALVQIFERKNRIIEHVKQQILVFDQHLASKCLIDGFVPPPWLLDSSPSELNKEDLISGLLFPHQQPSIPYSSLYQLPVVTTDHVKLPDFSCTGVDASSGGLDQCLSGKADELDPSVTSPPQDFRDGMTSDVCPDPGLSLARIQRSRSRQRALEHRNSAKACKNIESSEKNGVSGNIESEGSKIASLRSDPGDKLEFIRPDENAVSCAVENEEVGQHGSKERSKPESGPGNKLEFIRPDENAVGCAVENEEIGQHGSKERSKPESGPGNKLEFVRPDENVVSCAVENVEIGQYGSKERSKPESGPSGAGNTSCVAEQDGEGLAASVCRSEKQPVVVHELFKSKAVEPVDETAGCSEKNEKTGQCRSKERGGDVYSGTITRSTSSAQPLKSVNDIPSAGKRPSVAKEDAIVLTESTNKSRLQPETAEFLQIVKPLDNVVTCEVAREESGQFQSKQRGESIYSGRITRSRSSVLTGKSVNGFSCVGKACNVAKEAGDLLAESFSKRSSKARDRQSEEKENFVYQGRLTRSRSSSQGHNSMNKNLKLDSCASRSLDDGMSQSMHLACHVNDIMELIKPFDITNESCGMKSEISDCQREENAVIYQSNKGNPRSRANHSANLIQLADTSNSLLHEVTRSKSTGSNKFPYAKSSDRSKGDKFKEVSGTQVNALYSAKESDLAALNQFDTIVANTNADSNELVNAHSASSASNLDGAGNPPLAKSLNRSEKSEMEAVVTSLHSSPAMIVMPKQLDFDNLGDCTLNEESILTLESKEEIKSLEKRPLTPLADKLDEVTSVDYQEKCNSSLDNQLLEQCEAFTKEEKQYKTDLNKTSGPGRTSNLNVVSSVEETPEASTDAVTNILPESNKASELKVFMEDPSTASKVAPGNMLRQSPKDAPESYINVDTETNYLFKKDCGQLEVVKSVTSVPEACNRDTDVCSGNMILEDIDFTGVCSPDLPREADATSSDAIAHPSAAVTEETKGHSVKQIRESSASQNHYEDSIGRCTVNGIGSVPDPTHAKSSEDKVAIQSIQLGRHSGFHVEGSCPHKRRKIDGQQSYSLSLSLSSKEEDVMQLNADKTSVAEQDQIVGNCNWEWRDRSGNTPSTFMHKQFGVASVSSLPQETLQNSEDCLAGGTEAVDPSSSTGKCAADKNQILLNVGENSEVGNIEHLNCDETSKQETTEAVDPSSSARECAADKNQNLFGGKSEFGNIEHLTCDETSEQTEAVDPSCSSRKCAADDNQILLTVGEKTEFGNVEHLTCDETSKLENRTQLGEDGEFSAFPIRSPCLPPTDLLSAGQASPEFEGFIMETDSDQICIGADEINFDQLDLPKTTIERASLLEQLCKSACIDTPSSQFPTTYRLHQLTDLHQSVPNGLLECMDLKSTFPMNDGKKNQFKVSTSFFGEDMDHAFRGGYFSDCLPFSSSQVTGDVKKPYLSPVGKFWDRVTSNSGSSEKRRSRNPELPCISEEHENTDEVVDALKDCSASKGVPYSVERKPLAEISECPNIPASVSGAEIFSVRDSLDSVNTAYSFTGTKNGIKRKVGKHNGSKRRDTNKMKENLSIPPGENGTKRASESLRNRFSKPKLSEKTSLRKGGPSFSQKELKVNNIVSNVTSFIPIVQQKQAAAVITGKRDVKVKALEAAEAAKRLAEKKENDRKMKKEALKLERARLEQENLRQLELEKKKKEEERKKKEADMAAKKRQREEEERLEKERKRKRMDEARKQQRGPEEKLYAKKDEKEKKCPAPDERAQSLKVPNDEAVKHEKMQREIADGNEGKMLEKEPTTVVALTSDAVVANTAIEDCNEKVVSTVSRATDSDAPIADTTQEQSYDISPYKGSDDEDEEEEDDNEPNSKFIPSWASKTRVALAVAYQQNIDPEAIFPPKSFCSIAEVLLPRKLQQYRMS